MTTSAAEAQRIDTEIAAQVHRIEEAERRLGWAYDGLLSMYAHLNNVRPVYIRKVRTIPVSRETAIEWLASLDPEGYDLYSGAFTTHAKRLAEIREREAEVAREYEAYDALNAAYDGWARFFVVTSSAGHIHSSMSCGTCRVTTTYGWLPSLSGLTEADAVAECGPALCSVCFPSAPLDHLGKLTAAKARKLAA